MTKSTLAIAGLAAGLLFALPASLSPALAAGERVDPPRASWTFAGPFGTFDRAQLQRGYKVFREVCSSCHGATLLKFRNLAEPGGPEFSQAQVAALAAEYKIKDGPDESGEMFERPGRPADALPWAFANANQARTANGGALPPDMSVLAKARTYERGFPWFVIDIVTQYQEHGPDYINALLNGYVDEPPAGVTLQPGQYYNTYMPGHLIAMPNVLNDGQVEYPKGPDGTSPVPETRAQYAKDVSAFLVWVAEPHMEARKRIGLQVMLTLLVLSGLLYFTKKKIWARLPENSHGNAVT
jgi:ubiquinol-cytochrome c reductase cytochrome b/c1 subunit